LDGTHQLSAYVDDANIVGENIDTIKNNTKALLDASKEVGLEVNPQKTKYMLISLSQKMGKKRSIKIENRSFEDVVEFIYLRTTLTEQNWMHEEINSRLCSGNACYHSFQSLLSSRLLFRNLKVKIYKTIILSFVLYGCGAWSLTLREEHRVRVFENRVLRRIFGPKQDEVMEEWRKFHSGELYNLYLSPDIVRQIKLRRMSWVGHVAHMGEGRNLYRVLVGNPGGKGPLERPRHRWEDGIKMELREIDWGIGFSWLRIGIVWWALVIAVMNLQVLVPQLV
jgi:hypothetical protein